MQNGECSGKCSGDTGVLEPTLSFEERYKTGILKAAAKIKDGEIPVRLFKLTPVDKRIYKGSSVGQLFPLVDGETITKNCYFVSEHVIDNETKEMNGGLCSTGRVWIREIKSAYLISKNYFQLGMIHLLMPRKKVFTKYLCVIMQLSQETRRT